MNIPKMSIPSFVVNCFSSSGDISFGRVASGVTLIFCLGWDSAFVFYAMRHLDFSHMSIHDILPSAAALIAQGGFCSLFYGINKTTGMSVPPPADKDQERNQDQNRDHRPDNGQQGQ